MSTEPNPKTKNATMSLFTTIQTQIRDVDALKAACAELGVRLLRVTEARTRCVCGTPKERRFPKRRIARPTREAGTASFVRVVRNTQEMQVHAGSLPFRSRPRAEPDLSP